jgi:hypothetical protein
LSSRQRTNQIRRRGRSERGGLCIFRRCFIGIDKHYVSFNQNATQSREAIPNRAGDQIVGCQRSCLQFNIQSILPSQHVNALMAQQTDRLLGSVYMADLAVTLLLPMDHQPGPRHNLRLLRTCGYLKLVWMVIDSVRLSQWSFTSWLSCSGSLSNFFLVAHRLLSLLSVFLFGCTKLSLQLNLSYLFVQYHRRIGYGRASAKRPGAPWS